MNTTLGSEFLSLPLEIQCHIISNITEYRDIRRLRLVNSHVKFLVENSVRHVTWKYIEGEHLTINTDILLTLRNVRDIDTIYAETISDIINIANLPHLDYTNIVVCNDDLSLDQTVSLFVSQYCSGKYIEKKSNHTVAVYRHHRTLRHANFLFENGMPLDSSTFFINYGVICIDNLQDYPQSLRALDRARSLFGVKINYPLTKTIVEMLVKAPEFERVVLATGSPYADNVLNQVLYFLERRKLRILGDDPCFGSNVSDNNSFVENLSGSAIEDSPLEIWDLPVSVSHLQTVIQKFPRLKQVTVNLEKMEDRLLQEVGMLLEKYPQINSLGLDSLGMFEVFCQPKYIRELESKLETFAKRKIEIIPHI